MVTRWFSNHRKFNNIVADLQNKVTRLEGLAVTEEKKAMKFIEAHLNASELATKARTTAGNIGKLFG